MINAGMDIKGVAAEIQKDKSTPLVQKVPLLSRNIFVVTLTYSFIVCKRHGNLAVFEPLLSFSDLWLYNW